MSLSNLSSKDCRITPQRRIILEEVCKMDTHPTAAEIFKKVKKRIPIISFATVYRNLEFLEKHKLIKKLYSKSKEARYDGKEAKHYHLICKGCEKIIDVEDCACVLFKKEIFEKYEFHPDYQELELQGFCEDCDDKY